MVALKGVGARIKRGMMLSDTNVIDTSVTSALVPVVSGKTGNAVLTWSVAKNTFAVDTGRFAYITGGKAPALSFVAGLTSYGLTLTYRSTRFHHQTLPGKVIQRSTCCCCLEIA